MATLITGEPRESIYLFHQLSIAPKGEMRSPPSTLLTPIRRRCSDTLVQCLKPAALYYSVFKNGHPFCFCNNFVNRGQIFVMFVSFVAKEICNRSLLTDLNEIAGTLR